MKTVNASPAAIRLGALQWKETVVLLAVAVAVPFLVHLLPAWGGVPWGARLLPLFYAPFVGVLFFRLHVALVLALVAPALNALLTGLPGPTLVLLLTAELAAFALVAHLLLLRWPRAPFAGVLAYLLAKGISGLLIVLLPLFAALRPAPAFSAASVVRGLPGLTVLLLIGLWASRRRRHREDDA